jgi:hypothetical protein
MPLLFFKLVVTPITLYVVSRLARRWGETVGGILVGLPLTSAPVSFFLTLEHGAEFARTAIGGSLAAATAQTVFCVVYCRLAVKGWALALASATLAFATAAAVLQWCALPQVGLLITAVISIYASLNLIAKQSSPNRVSSCLWWDMPTRLIVVTALVIIVTLLAPRVGPAVSGILASFPIMAVVLAVFAHRTVGVSAAQQLIRGLVHGLVGFVAFFGALDITISIYQAPITAYTLAALAAAIPPFFITVLSHYSARMSINSQR